MLSICKELYRKVGNYETKLKRPLGFDSFYWLSKSNYLHIEFLCWKARHWDSFYTFYRNTTDNKYVMLIEPSYYDNKFIFDDTGGVAVSIFSTVIIGLLTDGVLLTLQGNFFMRWDRKWEIGYYLLLLKTEMN